VDRTRKIAIAAAVLYFVTHVTSIAALALYGPALHDHNFVLGADPVGGVLTGALAEVILTVAIVGTGVALYPVVRKHNEGMALGYAALRTLEAGIILVGVVSLLALVTMHQDGAGSNAAATLPVGRALVAVHDWTFLLGPNFVCAFDTFVLALVLYNSRLVPRFIPTLGLVGSVMLFAAAVGVLFGAFEQVSVWGAIAAAPVFAWELSLATWLLLKGFNPSAVRMPADDVRVPTLVSAA
jgi:hypothetical protein